MADMQTALRARLLAAAPVATRVGTRIDWQVRPQGAGYPSIRLQVISDPRDEHLKGYDGARQTRVQADCMALTYADAHGLAADVIAALASPATVGGVQFGRTKAEGPQDLGEATETEFVFRASVDLLVEHKAI